MSSSCTSPGKAWFMVMASTVSPAPAPAITTSDHSLKMVDLILTALAPRTASTSRPVDVEKYLYKWQKYLLQQSPTLYKDEPDGLAGATEGGEVGDVVGVGWDEHHVRGVRVAPSLHLYLPQVAGQRLAKARPARIYLNI